MTKTVIIETIIEEINNTRRLDSALGQQSLARKLMEKGEFNAKDYAKVEKAVRARWDHLS